tara:strand:+ start:78 stop:314 length:237 start_codon:yes stop_codon:yes gene_type:complete
LAQVEPLVKQAQEQLTALMEQIQYLDRLQVLAVEAVAVINILGLELVVVYLVALVVVILKALPHLRRQEQLIKVLLVA